MDTILATASHHEFNSYWLWHLGWFDHVMLQIPPDVILGVGGRLNTHSRRHDLLCEYLWPALDIGTRSSRQWMIERKCVNTLHWSLCVVLQWLVIDVDTHFFMSPLVTVECKTSHQLYMLGQCVTFYWSHKWGCTWNFAYQLTCHLPICLIKVCQAIKKWMVNSRHVCEFCQIFVDIVV